MSTVTEELVLLVIGLADADLAKSFNPETSEDPDTAAEELSSILEKVEKKFSVQPIESVKAEPMELAEEHTPYLWWSFPVEEPPYCGSMMDDDFPDYVTHWTPIPVPEDPT